MKKLLLSVVLLFGLINANAACKSERWSVKLPTYLVASEYSSILNVLSNQSFNIRVRSYKGNITLYVTYDRLHINDVYHGRFDSDAVMNYVNSYTDGGVRCL